MSTTFGNYAEVKSTNLLRALIGPEAEKVMPARELARQAHMTHQFINHLMTGRRSRVSTTLAKHIAAALGVNLTMLFQPAPSITRQQTRKRRAI